MTYTVESLCKVYVRNRLTGATFDIDRPVIKYRLQHGLQLIMRV